MKTWILIFVLVAGGDKIELSPPLPTLDRGHCIELGFEYAEFNPAVIMWRCQLFDATIQTRNG